MQKWEQKLVDSGRPNEQHIEYIRQIGRDALKRTLYLHENSWDDFDLFRESMDCFLLPYMDEMPHPEVLNSVWFLINDECDIKRTFVLLRYYTRLYEDINNSYEAERIANAERKKEPSEMLVKERNAAKNIWY